MALNMPQPNNPKKRRNIFDEDDSEFIKTIKGVAGVTNALITDKGNEYAALAGNAVTAATNLGGRAVGALGGMATMSAGERDETGATIPGTGRGLDHVAQSIEAGGENMTWMPGEDNPTYGKQMNNLQTAGEAVDTVGEKLLPAREWIEKKATEMGIPIEVAAAIWAGGAVVLETINPMRIPKATLLKFSNLAKMHKREIGALKPTGDVKPAKQSLLGSDEPLPPVKTDVADNALAVDADFAAAAMSREPTPAGAMRAEEGLPPGRPIAAEHNIKPFESDAEIEALKNQPVGSNALRFAGEEAGPIVGPGGAIPKGMPVRLLDAAENPELNGAGQIMTFPDGTPYVGLDREYWKSIPAEEKLRILRHEEGHYVMGESTDGWNVEKGVRELWDKYPEDMMNTFMRETYGPAYSATPGNVPKAVDGPILAEELVADYWMARRSGDSLDMYRNVFNDKGETLADDLGKMVDENLETLSEPFKGRERSGRIDRHMKNKQRGSVKTIDNDTKGTNVLAGAGGVEPLYHGTTADLGPSGKLLPSKSGEFGPGVYLSNREESANMWGSRNLKPGEKVSVIQAENPLQNPFTVTKQDWIEMTADKTPKEVQAALKAKGHDGIIGIGINGVDKQYVVFDANALKRDKP